MLDLNRSNSPKLAIKEKEQAEKIARLAKATSDRAIEKQKEAEESACLAKKERDSAKTDNNTLLNEIEIEINKKTLFTRKN